MIQTVKTRYRKLSQAIASGECLSNYTNILICCWHYKNLSLKTQLSRALAHTTASKEITSQKAAAKSTTDKWRVEKRGNAKQEKEKKLNTIISGNEMN